MEAEARAARFRAEFTRLAAEIGRVIVGQEDVVEGVLTCLFCGGHCLLEGVPGLGKTHLVRTLAHALDLRFSRIQFTPDLMPADIIGTNMIAEDEQGRRHFRFERGPVFANIILADEINRATPKTQSAMLEAMQEHRVSVGGETYALEEPFLVMATQNPLEMEGTYPLPEAQLDRFLFKVLVPFPGRKDLTEILERTTERISPSVSPVLDGIRVREMQETVREVAVAPHVRDYAVRLVLGTHPNAEGATEMVRKYVRYGASPRGAQALILAGKVRALTEGRYNVGFADIECAALPALRHRLILNFEGEAEGVVPDRVIEDLLRAVPKHVDLATA